MKDKKSLPLRRDRHLRLTLRIGEGEAEVLEMQVVNEPVVEPGRVSGPFVIAVTAGGELLWVDSMIDPLVRRGAPRPGEREHHYSRAESATIVTRVPLPSGKVPEDFRVVFHEATGALPERVADLAGLLRLRRGRPFRRLASVGLPALRKHRDWEKVAPHARFGDTR